jgi:hypothetical protein
MSVVIERVRLSYRAGRSDKVYEIELIAEEDGLFTLSATTGGVEPNSSPNRRRSALYRM